MCLRRVVLATALSAALLACGGGGSSSKSSSAGRTDAIRSCLEAAKVDTTTSNDKAVGVSDDFKRVIAHEDPTDKNTITEIFVFDSNAQARQNRPALTLQTEDNQLNQVIGPVVVRFGHVPQTAYRSTVTGCVEQATSSGS